MGMATRWQTVLGLATICGVVTAPVVYSSHLNTHARNIRVVEEGVLYRSGQLSPEGLERIVSERGIKTVVTLRTSRVVGKLPPDSWEADFCATRGLNHVRIVPRVWSPDEKGEVPAEEAVREFIAVMDKKENYPVLVHCFAGIHRTGIMCAIFRMEYDHWSAERAIAEMQQCGFDPVDMKERIEGYLRSYQPRWKQADE
jgi:tyrosine-protein phosphatase SIW14